MGIRVTIPERSLSEQVKTLSRVQLFATLWTIAWQAPLSTEFSRQEYWNRLPFPPPGYLPDPGIEPGSPALQADSLYQEAVISTCKTLQPHHIDVLIFFFLQIYGHYRIRSHR